MLFEPAQLEPLTDELWDPARVEDAIATIVADADAAFDPEALSPAHDWDGWRAPLPMKNLYVGAAGVIWALDALRRRGHAETSLDLTATALRTLDLERAERELDARARPTTARMASLSRSAVVRRRSARGRGRRVLG